MSFRRHGVRPRRGQLAPTLLPTPLPIAERLQALAWSPGTRPRARPNALGWQREDDWPWAARRLCSELKIGWRGRAPSHVVNEVLGDFGSFPDRRLWLAETIYHERTEMGVEVADRVLALWRSLDLDPPRAVTLLAASVASRMGPTDAAKALAQGRKVEADWQPWLAWAVADGQPAVAAEALDQLFFLLRNPADRVRIDAALVAARLVAASKDSAREEYVESLIEALKDRFFQQNPHLRRELKRLGLTTGR